ATTRMGRDSGSITAGPHATICASSSAWSARRLVMDDAELIYDWNAPERSASRLPRPALLDDTLRDGLQSTAVRQPSLDERVELLGAMARAGIGSVNLGLPAVSAEAF